MVGVHCGTLAIVMPNAQIIVKNEPNASQFGCFMIRSDLRKPAVEKSIIGGMRESESNDISGNVGNGSSAMGNESSPPSEGNRLTKLGL